MLRRVIPALAALALLSPLLAGTPAAEAATTTKPKWGASTKDNASFDALNRTAGPLSARRTFQGALPTSFSKSLAASDVAAKRTSYWSFKPNMKTFASDSAAQTAFSKFLDTIPAGHQTVIIGWHEPEDDIAAGKFTVAQYGATQNKLGQIIDSKRRAELRLALCFMGQWTFDNRSPYYKYNWDAVINFSYVDVIGIDPYKFRYSTPSLQTMLTVPNSGAGGSNPSMMAKINSWGKPAAIMEWGVRAKDSKTGQVIPESARAKFISDGYAWMKSWNANSANRKIEAANYFHLEYNGYSNLLVGSMLTAYTAAARDSRV
jgi:hypothetical protein